MAKFIDDEKKQLTFLTVLVILAAPLVVFFVRNTPTEVETVQQTIDERVAQAESDFEKRQSEAIAEEDIEIILGESPTGSASNGSGCIIYLYFIQNVGNTSHEFKSSSDDSKVSVTPEEFKLNANENDQLVITDCNKDSSWSVIVSSAEQDRLLGTIKNPLGN